MKQPQTRSFPAHGSVVSLALEQALRSWEGVLEILPVGVSAYDAEGGLVRYNQRAAEIWGHWPSLDENRPYFGSGLRTFRVNGEPLQPIETPLGETLSTGRQVRNHEVLLERPDGRRITVLADVEPLFDSVGQLVGAVACFQDITALRQAEAHQSVLVDELNHRVKNTLAAVQSIASHTLRGTGVPETVRSTFESRLFALSQAHDQLTTRRWESADLRSLVESIFEPYRDETSERVRIEGETVKLAPQTALVISMVLGELAINASKYGSLTAPAGTVGVTWAVNQTPAGPRLTIDWTEAGGPTVEQPARQGFGSRLMQRGIAEQLKGNTLIDFKPTGVHCKMDVPLSPDVQ